MKDAVQKNACESQGGWRKMPLVFGLVAEHLERSLLLFNKYAVASSPAELLPSTFLSWWRSLMQCMARNCPKKETFLGEIAKPGGSGLLALK